MSFGLYTAICQGLIIDLVARTSSFFHWGLSFKSWLRVLWFLYCLKLCWIFMAAQFSISSSLTASEKIEIFIICSWVTITINSNFVCKEGVNILQEILYANRGWYIVVVIVRKSRKCRPWFWLVVLYLTKTIHNIVQVLTIAYYKANAEGKEWRLTVDLKEEISIIKRRAV